MVELQVKVEPNYGGSVYLDSILITSTEFKGVFYKGILCQLGIKNEAGFEFNGFETISGESIDNNLVILNDTSIVARFTSKNEQNKIRINEVSYNNDFEYGTKEWIELYNSGESSINLNSYKLKVNIEVYDFQKNIVIQAKEYIIIAKSSRIFKSVFPDHTNIIEWKNLNIDANFEIKLLRRKKVLEEVYSSGMPGLWKEGYSLELKSPLLSGKYSKNRKRSIKKCGSPNLQNGTTYEFTPPSSSNSEIHFAGSTDRKDLNDWLNSSDEDNHEFVGVEFVRATNKNAFLYGGKALLLNTLYENMELSIDPISLNIFDEISYQLVDAVGEKSKIYVIRLYKNN